MTTRTESRLRAPSRGAVVAGSSRWPWCTARKYDDWSWAKGKLDPGEELAGRAPCARRRRRPAWSCGLGPAAARRRVHGARRDRAAGDKEVRYWAAEATSPAGPLLNEIDEVRWLDVDRRRATPRLRPRPRPAARARAGRQGRHADDVAARAGAARARRGPRLVARGRPAAPPRRRRAGTHAAVIAPLLTAYGVTRLVSSPSLRCTDTLRPYAAAARCARCAPRTGSARRGMPRSPARAVRHLERLVERGAPAALCSHGPVLPALLDALRALVDPTSRMPTRWARTLRSAARDKMAKGEVLVGPPRRHRRGRPGGRRRAPPAPLSLRAGALVRVAWPLDRSRASLTRRLVHPLHPRGRCGDLECLTGVHRPFTLPGRCVTRPPYLRGVGHSRPPLISPCGEVLHREDSASRPGGQRRLGRLARADRVRLRRQHRADAGASSSSTHPSACPKGGTLNGEGSSAQKNAIEEAISSFQDECAGTTVNYNPTGSGAGIKQFTAGQVDFAGSDSALKTEEKDGVVEADAAAKMLRLPRLEPARWSPARSRSPTTSRASTSSS